MRSFSIFGIFTASLMATTAMATAADLPEPPMVEVIPEVRTISTGGGWYLRGDIGYAHTTVKGVSYYQGTSLSGAFEQHDVEDSWMLSGGIGYQITDYFRADLTLGHYFASDFNGSSAQNVAVCTGTGAASCTYTDNGEFAATVLLANAYLDLGTYSSITPYVGAGIGGALVHWGDVTNTESDDAGIIPSVSSNHGGNGEWRFAYALHAGASYDLSHNMKLDAGYTFTHIDGGHMFDFDAASGSGPQGFDGGIKIHTVRAGVRWSIN